MSAPAQIQPAGPPIVAHVERPARAERIAALVQRQGALAVLVLVAVIAGIVFENFATWGNLTNMLIQASSLGMIAIGMTFVIITGGIDLSVGSLFVLGGVVAAWASQYGLLPALLAPLLVTGLIGLVQGLLIGRAGLAPFIVTLAGLLGARGLMLAITTGGSVTYKVDRTSAFAWLGQGTWLGIGIPVWITAALFAAGMVWLNRTRTGQWLYGVGGSEDAASLMGLPVARVKVTVYVISGLLSGLAGALNAARLVSGVTTLGVGLELDVIAAVVIGGTLLIGGAGTLGGTLAGVGLLMVIQNVINQIGSLGASFQSVVSGAFLGIVVILQALLAKAQRLRD